MSSLPSGVAALLRGAEDCVAAGRRVEVEAFEHLLAYADTFSGDPQEEPGAVPIRYGGPRLVALGGDGTPEVADLPLVELAVARHESVQATRNALGDALDLRHRLPRVWSGVRELRCPLWVVRKVARMSRSLTREAVVLVDVALAAALDESPARILDLAEAKVIEADTAAHEQRLRRARRRRGVWVSRPRPGEQVDDQADTAGTAGVFARLERADAEAWEAAVADLAGLLATHSDAGDVGDDLGLDHWRAEAFALLADPAAALDFLRRAGGGSGPSADVEDALAATSSRPRAQVYLHVACDAAGEIGPVARVEQLGPMLSTRLGALLGRHDIILTPVIDLHHGRSVNAYEHPTDVRLRTELRTVVEPFPHSSGAGFTRRGRPPDHDHTVAYDPHGPPGQTGDHNDTPLRRHHHRAKTHAAYTVTQIGPDRWVWRTPHGLRRLVGAGGTRRLPAVEVYTRPDLVAALAPGAFDDVA